MAYEVLRMRSFKATGSLASSQFCFVKIDTSGGIALPSAGGYAIGVLQDKPAAGDPGAVCSPGDITKVVSGGAFAAGQGVSTDASGNAIAAISADYQLGIALQAATGSAQTVSILYQPMPHLGSV